MKVISSDDDKRREHNHAMRKLELGLDERRNNSLDNFE